MNTKHSTPLTRSENKLSIDQACIAYGDKTVVNGANLNLKDGEIGCLLGPSGCGKSTLLRAIAGFEPLTDGQICMDEKKLSTQDFSLPTEKRRIGMVFQDVALFPHLSIADNIAFGIRDLSKEEQKSRIVELLNLVGLPDCRSRYPHSLSGGQQQRIALARALAPFPDVLLLDEPFSGLDAKLRESLVPEVRSILKSLHISALMVSHDQSEAFAIADKIGVMAAGKIAQWGTPSEVFSQPANRFVAEFISSGEFLKGKVKHATTSGYSLETALGCINVQQADLNNADAEVDILIRTENLRLDPQSATKAKITSRIFRGAYILYQVKLANGEHLHCTAPTSQPYEIGTEVGLSLQLERPILFQ